MKRLVLLMIAAFGGNAFAGEILIHSRAHLYLPPEYVDLRVSVAADCETTPQLARQNANAVSKKLVSFLNSKIDANNSKEGVYVNGGAIVKSPGKYIRTSAGQQYVCVDTFQKKIDIVVKTTDIKNFEVLFDEIENQTYSLSTKTASAKPSVVVTIAKPQAHLTSKSIESLKVEALKDAISKGREKLKELSQSLCGLKSYSITSVKELKASTLGKEFSNPYAGTRGRPMNPSVGGAPVAFENIWVSKAVDILFEYTPGECAIR